MSRQVATKKSNVRGDIQGLRAVAVLLVVGDHVLGWPHGGFIGVDVFFVISGFLITGILLRQQLATGQVDLPQFYARRLRRIVPVSFLVTALTVALGYFIWFRPHADQNLIDGFWSTLWVANWHFSSMGADYLAGTGSPPALQHLWSLSVEEQFYVVWPWVLLFAGSTFVQRLGKNGGIYLILGGIVFLSFAWSAFAVSHYPRSAYFDTVGRVWELGTGGLLAVFHSRSSWRPRNGVLGWAGSFLIILGAFVITKQTPFPGPWALLPVLGSLLVLMNNPQSSSARIFDNIPLRWIGDRSYSLYLWHFPVLICALSVNSNPSFAVKLGLILLAVLFSALSYRFVEEPARHSKWLRSWETPSNRRKDLLLGASITVLVALLAASQFNSGKVGVLQESTISRPRAGTTIQFKTEAEAKSAVEQGLVSTSYDSLTPSPDLLGQSQLASTMDRGGKGCTFDLAAKTIKPCVFGSGSRKVLVIGDSVAMVWTPAVRAAVGSNATVLVAGFGSCAPWKVTHGVRYRDPSFKANCAHARTVLDDLVKTTKPDVVIAAGAVGGYKLVDVPPNGLSAQQQWREGVRESVSLWRQSAAKVVVVGFPPLGEDPKDCINRLSGPKNCISTIEDFEKQATDAEREGTRAAGGIFVDVTSWFCSADGRCPTVIGPYMSRTDTTHITAALSGAYGPVLKIAAKL